VLVSSKPVCTCRYIVAHRPIHSTELGQNGNVRTGRYYYQHLTQLACSGVAGLDVHPLKMCPEHLFQSLMIQVRVSCEKFNPVAVDTLCGLTRARQIHEAFSTAWSDVNTRKYFAILGSICIVECKISRVEEF